MFSEVCARMFRSQLNIEAESYCVTPTIYYCGVPLAQRIARWTSNPKVLGSTPRWDDNFFSLFSQSACDMEAKEQPTNITSFHSVAVITCASHAQGRRFKPGWKQTYFSSFVSLPFVADVDDAH